MDKIVNILKNKDAYIPFLLLNNYKKLNLTDQELIILILLINSNEYNPKLISDIMDIKLPLLLELISNLEEKGMIKIELKNINGVNTEICILDNLYEKMSLIVMKKEDDRVNKTIYDTDEEILKLALKEATYNGVSNFRYIDRIIHEWKKKGIKTRDDVIKNNEEFRKKKETKKQELFDYDWLNE